MRLKTEDTVLPSGYCQSNCNQYYDEGKDRLWWKCIREDDITHSREPWEGFHLEGCLEKYFS